MEGVLITYCNVCINALIKAACNLYQNSPAVLLNKTRYGKGDTCGFDAIPEIIIKKNLSDFDSQLILITEELYINEEKKWPSNPDPLFQPLMFFSDPTDRSNQLKKFIEQIAEGDNLTKFFDLTKKIDLVGKWENFFEAPAVITGATTSITCLRQGKLIFTVILNYITGHIFLACDVGVYTYQLPSFNITELSNINFDHIIIHGHRLFFPSIEANCSQNDDCLRFVTFLGKSGYQQNFNDSMIFVANADQYLHHTEPGGPARILYLSELQNGYGPVGFILANGEKIGEWMGWFSFVKFATNSHGVKALKAFEISIDRPWVKDNVLMSNPLPYSIFQRVGNYPFIDISGLQKFSSPNKFRGMFLITPADNERIIYIMTSHNYREVTEYL